jgi:hypothetical protein
MTKHLSRRSLLRRGVQLPIGGLLLASAGSAAALAADKVCADVKNMDSGQKSIREALNYVEKSPDPAKTCGACGFFMATADGCGTCMIFTGPANAMGHCESWSAKS